MESDLNAPVVIESPSPSPEPAPVKKAVNKTVVVKVPRILRDETRYADDSLCQIVVTSYDSGGNVVKEETLNQKKQLMFRKLIELSADGRLQTVTTSNQYNEIQGIAQRDLDAQGRIVQERLLNAKKELQSVSEFAWDADGNPISWISRERDHALVVATTYLLAAGRVQAIELRDEKGLLIRRFAQTWDSAGQLIRKTEFDPSGAALTTINYFYAQGLLDREEYHKADGSLVRSIVYQYDGRHLPVELRYLDRQGRVTEIHKQDFQLFDKTETITVYE